MSTFLWWVGDALLLVVALPTVVLLLTRIIRPLRTAHRAVRGIGRSAQEITASLPGAVSELSAMADAARRASARAAART